MDICYAIITCQKYLPTRCEWQKRSWLKYVSKYVFISSIPDIDNRVVGWNAPDDYAGCAQKYVDFFRNTPPSADWTVCVDDDTFVFPERLENLLKLGDPSKPMYIGKIVNVDPNYPPYMSGGSGFAISRTFHAKIHEFLNNTSFVPMTIYSDITMGEWARHLGAQLFRDDRFNSDPHFSVGNIETSITFHRVTETLFEYYLTILERSTVQSPINSINLR